MEEQLFKNNRVKERIVLDCLSLVLNNKIKEINCVFVYNIIIKEESYTHCFLNLSMSRSPTSLINSKA